MENPKLIYDIFCDASVGPNLRGCCSGALIERRQNIQSYPNRTFQYTIQPKGTNNSGEVAAVALGVSCAISLHLFAKINSFEIPRFNIFSDSLITIRGVREWLPGWIRNSDEAGNLMNSSNAIVANQEYFKFIYNSIISIPDIDINFYHQDGHVTKYFDSIRKNFYKFNGIIPEDIGKTPISLCSSNDFVDRETRRIINEYLNTPKEYLPENWKDGELEKVIQSFKNDTIINSAAGVIKAYTQIIARNPSQ